MLKRETVLVILLATVLRNVSPSDIIGEPSEYPVAFEEKLRHLTKNLWSLQAVISALDLANTELEERVIALRNYVECLKEEHASKTAFEKLVVVTKAIPSLKVKVMHAQNEPQSTRNANLLSSLEDFVNSYTYTTHRISITMDDVRFWKVSNFSHIIWETKTSGEFPIEHYPFKIQVKITDLMSEFAIFVRYIGDFENLGVNPVVIVAIRDQSKKSKHLIRSSHTFYRSAVNYSSFQQIGEVPFNYLMDAKYDYWTNDNIMVAAYVEPPSVSQQYLSTNGTLYWAVSNYEHKLKMAITAISPIQLSPYFLVYPNGPKVQLVLELDGEYDQDMRYAVLVVEFVIHNDDLNSKSFTDKYKYVVTFTAVNLNGYSRDIEVSGSSKTSLRLTVAPYQRMKRRGFFHNETLFYKAGVKIVDINTGETVTSNK